MKTTVLGIKVLVFRGATMYEGQIGPYWFSVNYLRYWWTVPLGDIVRFGKELG